MTVDSATSVAESASTSIDTHHDEQYQHVDPDVRTILKESESVRDGAAKEDYWIKVPLAEEAVSTVRGLVTSTATTRPDCALIMGDTNMGKSATIKRLRKIFPYEKERIDETTMRTISPFVSTEVPGDSTPKKMLENILYDMEVDSRLIPVYMKNHSRALNIIADAKVRVVALNAVQQFDNAGLRTQEFIRGLLLELSERGISLVFVGSAAAEIWVDADESLGNRTLYRHVLRPFALGKKYQSFLAAAERRLFLREPSNLALLHAERLHGMTNGSVGENVSLLRLASRSAIGKEEMITEAVLNRIKWTSPTERRNLTEE